MSDREWYDDPEVIKAADLPGRPPACSPGYRCTGAQAACGCGFRGQVFKGADRHKRAEVELREHIAEKRRTDLPARTPNPEEET